MPDEILRERRRAQEQQELLIAELNHRVRNILNLIRSLVSQSQDDAQSVASFAAIIGGRISALASAHDNITRENWAPAPLSALFETELAAYIAAKPDRFTFMGDEVLIKPEAYPVLALVVHELVTNSAKYGCLSDGRGCLKVSVLQTRGGELKIKWRESGGPPVKPPKRRGFGSKIIERSIPFELKGKAELNFKLTGLEGDFMIPARYVEQISAKSSACAETASRTLMAAAKERGNANAKAEERLPGHVLVVEDSMIIALDTEENLKRLGVKSVKIESNVAGALKAITEHQPDFAIVDYNLGPESSTPVAQELTARGIRFALATGYSEAAGQFHELGACALIRKPYGRDEIQNVLAA